MPDKNIPEIISAAWPAPEHVRAFTTTRQGGQSRSNYSSLNLALHVEDNVDTVEQNRKHLSAAFNLPTEPFWLQQTHSSRVTNAGNANNNEADGAWSKQTGVVCTVLTADCLPVFFCDRAGTTVAIVHAGWRGLMDGVISSAITEMNVDPENLLVWLGPAIGPEAFEVGEEVLQQFSKKNPINKAAFIQKDVEHWLCDIYQLARIELNQKGVQQIYGGDLCTYSDEDRFYSYRRDGVTGRMASLIWMEN